MSQLTGKPFIEVTRGGLVESVHEVAACAVDRQGEVVLAMGDIETPVYLRSAAKPFIAAAVIKYGAQQRFGLEQHEIALMAASHSGEPFHVEGVASILRKIGLPQSALQCGAHAPYNSTAAIALERAGQPFTALHNNCSGKHAGILALCLLLGSDTTTYMDLHNTAQQEVLKFCARVTGDDPSTFPLGVDGCGIPVFATSLHHAAQAFFRFATLTNVEPKDAHALAMVRDAMISYPWYVSGTGEFDATLMDASGGSIACKAGAEGVHGVAALEAGFGLALKVLDGSKRAVAPASTALLDHLQLLNPAALTQLRPFLQPQLINRSGRVVGELRAQRAILG
ncbi:MAG: asparaginase [Candidatus Eremiobacteraeota bacterium]|nr:asparaginase [Candidatus Eremiobacteraeota bacterium]